MLRGIRIVEIEALGPAPFAGMLLADLGADVIVVHRKHASMPGAPERSLLDRGKRSIALDLKNGDDVAVLMRLIATADGLIEGFRPGVMERLGLGPDLCHAANPRLVYGRMTGWGQHGPLAATAGHDLNYIGLSGALWYASLPGEPPMAPPTLVGDIGGGALYLVVGMLAGIMNARAGGKGTVVDAAIVDGSAHMMNLLMSLGQSGALATERGRSLLDGPHWCRVYRTSEGGFISVQCIEPKFYALFLDRLGLATDPNFARQFDRVLWPELGDRLAAIFATKPRDEWISLFEGSDACVGPVLGPHEAALHPHMAARGTWQTVDGALQAAAAPRFSGARWTPPKSPARGEHDAEIRAGLAES
ncbi:MULTISPECIES: CaiB/BaiF CoA-transferase family protein [unclassified Mesorhizobium]|uniref:CaiB/BaiF CoA transferase family protein n=1 Tax=unclassified Mesorhizobium TaxID=325217 RepID=UPI000F74DB68|nr:MULTISPECIES: CaiB/BaiF CoA-transferase family protein [unclassified Mesorhizobium]AZO53602.1 CoA transferase [Mesorhizobium sp. M8A.F.Ca.ET.057.01.1.1]RWE41340.1 MAG: CoA transferase [Mesorhizobium sp.]